MTPQLVDPDHGSRGQVDGDDSSGLNGVEGAMCRSARQNINRSPVVGEGYGPYRRCGEAPRGPAEGRAEVDRAQRKQARVEQIEEARSRGDRPTASAGENDGLTGG